jgi:hypothetical protein
MISWTATTTVVRPEDRARAAPAERRAGSTLTEPLPLAARFDEPRDIRNWKRSRPRSKSLPHGLQIQRYKGLADADLVATTGECIGSTWSIRSRGVQDRLVGCHDQGRPDQQRLICALFAVPHLGIILRSKETLTRRAR